MVPPGLCGIKQPPVTWMPSGTCGPGPGRGHLGWSCWVGGQGIIYPQRRAGQQEERVVIGKRLRAVRRACGRRAGLGQHRPAGPLVLPSALSGEALARPSGCPSLLLLAHGQHRCSAESSLWPQGEQPGPARLPGGQMTRCTCTCHHFTENLDTWPPVTRASLPAPAPTVKPAGPPSPPPDLPQCELPLQPWSLFSPPST